MGDGDAAVSCRQPLLVLAQVPALRQAGKAAMTEPVTCAECIHFRRDEINPAAGLGFCELRRIAKYPGELHYCRQREVEDDGD